MRVLYFPGYKNHVDSHEVADIEAAADEVVRCRDDALGFTASRRLASINSPMQCTTRCV